MVSILSRGGEVCIAYASVLVNLWTRGIFLDICTSTARLTKTLKLVPDIFSKSVPLYQAVGTQAHVAKIPFKLNGQIERICRRLLASPRLGTKVYFTENNWYKLRLLIQPSSTGTNIQEYASGPIN